MAIKDEINVLVKLYQKFGYSGNTEVKKIDLRPSRQEIHMKTAVLWGQRSSCKRPNRKIGCVITNHEMTQVLSIGYNGPPRGRPNNSCNGEIGCDCVHAEINAIVKCHRNNASSIRVFVTMEPCINCANAIIQVGASHVYYIQEYRKHDGIERLKQCGVRVLKMNIKN